MPKPTGRELKVAFLILSIGNKLLSITLLR